MPRRTVLIETLACFGNVSHRFTLLGFQREILPPLFLDFAARASADIFLLGLLASCPRIWHILLTISSYFGAPPKLNIDNVMCQYHPCQERTSYSSRPTSPFASSKHCSTVQRAPKASTISPKEVPVGAKISTYAISAGSAPSF